MESVRQTKLRLVREAVQDNIQVARVIRVKPASQRKRIFSPPLWLWGALSVTGLVYLALPLHVVLRGSSSSPGSSKLIEAVTPSAVAGTTIKPEISASAPRPLNRAVFPLSIKRIVVDPGHGGKQTGAISESGVAEKEITLDIGLRLRRLLEKQFNVMMTRQADQTIPLEKRVAFANENSADLFVSIHVN